MAKRFNRRAVDTEALNVLSVADISNIKTLDERVDTIVENRNSIVVANLEYIQRQRNISQAHMCNIDLEGSPLPPQMAAYKQQGKDIPFRTVARIATAYGYAPEQLYGQLLEYANSDAVQKSSYPVDAHRKHLNPHDIVTDAGLNTILYGPPGTGKTYHTA